MEVKNSIAVFGGSFNPPLNSHFSIAEQVLNQYEKIERVIFVPVNKRYPKDGLIENEHRYQMLKRVVDKNNHFLVSDIDMYNDHSLSTIETIEENTQTRHVTISTEKLKELIKENYKWNDYTLQGKIDIVTNLAYFENDKELLEFLEYMEE